MNIVVAISIILLLSLSLSLILIVMQRLLPKKTNPLVDKINSCLPQTQCAQCGFPGCAPYAKAIADDNAAINLCPPGGDATVHKLAELTGTEFQAVDKKDIIPAQIAVIDEDLCIGCTKCLAPCPPDAIIGAPKHMHTVINNLCTGCGLCIEPCPMDCIKLIAKPLTTNVLPHEKNL